MKLTVIIQQGTDGGWTISTEEVPELIGSGWSKESALVDFGQVTIELAESYYQRDGKYPEWNDAEYEFVEKPRDYKHSEEVEEFESKIAKLMPMMNTAYKAKKKANKP